MTTEKSVDTYDICNPVVSDPMEKIQHHQLFFMLAICFERFQFGRTEKKLKSRLF